MFALLFEQVHLDNVTAFVALYSVNRIRMCVFFLFAMIQDVCVIRFNPACRSIE